jgi:hypothetical protein
MPAPLSCSLLQLVLNSAGPPPLAFGIWPLEFRPLRRTRRSALHQSLTLGSAATFAVDLCRFASSRFRSRIPFDVGSWMLEVGRSRIRVHPRHPWLFEQAVVLRVFALQLGF